MANSQSGKGKVNDELGASNKMPKTGKSSKKDEDMSKKKTETSLKEISLVKSGQFEYQNK